MLKLVFLLGVATALSTAPVLAADIGEPLAEKNPSIWSGGYVGIVGSYNWGDTDWTFKGSGSSIDHSSNGGGIGVTAGYNWTLNNNVVLGVEGDISWLDADGGTECPNPTFSCNSEVEWLGTLRARAGYAMGQFLPFVTGGAAFGSVKLSSPAVFIYPEISETKSRFGWAAGAGFEYSFNNNWSTKVDYLHIDLGKGDYFSDGDLSRGSWSSDSIRVGLNYNF